MTERRIPRRDGVKPPRAKSDHAEADRRGRRAGLRLLVATLGLVGLLFVFAFPTSALLDQRGRIQDAQHQVSVLEQQTKKLDEEAARLRSDTEVERIARERYFMVRPGEKSWAVVPPATTTTTAPPKRSKH